MDTITKHNIFLSSISVLLVEDEPQVLQSMQNILSRRVGEVYTASNGQEGIDVYREKKPDVIISDVQLPDMDGLDMSKIIREELNAEVPIIIVSAHGKEDYFLKAIDVGVSKYMKKPVDKHEMEKVLIETATILFNHKRIEQLNLKIYDVLDLLKSMVILTDGEMIRYANKAFLEFTSFETFQDFSNRFSYVEDLNHLIVKVDDMIIKNDQGWFYYMKDNMDKTYVSFLHDVKENTSAAFITTISQLPNNPDDFLLTFSDITDIERSRLDLAKESQSSEQLKMIIREKAEELYEKDKMLMQQSKMATMGEMLGAITHQWKQPISVLSLMIQNLKDAYDFNELTPDKMNRAYERVLENTKFMGETIDEFKNFLVPKSIRRSFSVQEAIDKTVFMLQPQFHTLDIAIQTDYACVSDDKEENCSHAKVYGLVNEFMQVTLNLIINAKDAIMNRRAKEMQETPGIIKIQIVCESDNIAVNITDNGGGIPKEHLSAIFDSYFTTKPEGTGIGLYMSKIIIESHMQGRIYVQNGEEGAEFSILIPRCHES